MIIRGVLLPEKLHSVRFFAQRILSITTLDNHIRGVVVHIKGKNSFVEKLLEKEFNPATDQKDTSFIAALQELISEAGKIHEIRVVIPAATTIIKELEVPFLDPQKIRMVVEYELEPLLPFALEATIVDFVITKSNKESSSSQILAVAIRKEDLQAILDPYIKANIKVATTSIDMLGTYSIYEQIPAYRNLPGSTALIDVGDQGTRIIFLLNNQLKLTRYITKGLSHIIQNASEETGSPQEDIAAYLTTIGAKTPDAGDMIGKAVHKQIVDFLNEIQFTLNSFSLKLNYYEGVSKIFFLGKANAITGLNFFGSELLQISSEFFDPSKIFDAHNIKNSLISKESISPLFTLPLGGALPAAMCENFNLRREEFALLDYELGFRQIVTAGVLFIVTAVGLGFFGYFQTADLQAVVTDLETDQISNLKPLLPKEERARVKRLPILIQKTEEIVKEKHSLWSPFSLERIKPLELLLEVTRTFDKTQYSLDVEELTISEKEGGNPVIEIEGYFRSDKGLGYHHTEWVQLEERIKESPLLALMEPPSSTPAAEKGLKFSVKLHKKPTGQPA